MKYLLIIIMLTGCTAISGNGLKSGVAFELGCNQHDIQISNDTGHQSAYATGGGVRYFTAYCNDEYHYCRARINSRNSGYDVQCKNNY